MKRTEIKPEVWGAILNKIDGIKALTQYEVELKPVKSEDETLVYIYDKRDGQEMMAGGAKKVLDNLADWETTLYYMHLQGYRLQYMRKGK